MIDLDGPAPFTTHVTRDLDHYLHLELAALVRDYSLPAHGHSPAHVRARIHALTTPHGDQP